MSPFVKSLPSYIKDTNHALKTFRYFNFPGQNKLIFTMDITSLYTVIPRPTTKDSWHSNIFLTNALTNNLAPKRLFASLNSFSHLTAFPSRITITSKLTESLWALNGTYNVVMLTFLSASSNNNISTNSTALNRNSTVAIDDCFGAASCSRQELDYFIILTSVNSFHPALKYTWEVSECSIAFLDINVSIGGNRLSTSVHYKPTDSHSYLLHSSSHPVHVKNSIPYSQFLRLCV